MSRPGRSLAERRLRWTVLLGNARQHLDEVPYIQGDLDELDRISEEVGLLLAEKAKVQAQAQALSARLGSLGRQGDRLRGRLGALLKGYYGFDAERLVAFGFRPRRSKERDPETESRLRGEAPQEEEAAEAQDADGGQPG